MQARRAWLHDQCSRAGGDDGRPRQRQRPTATPATATAQGAPLDPGQRPQPLRSRQPVLVACQGCGSAPQPAHRYAAAKEACAASGDGALEEVSFEEFGSAVRLVGSRCLRLSMGRDMGRGMGREHSVRRMLVPVLDLANHDGQVSDVLLALTLALTRTLTRTRTRTLTLTLARSRQSRRAGLTVVSQVSHVSQVGQVGQVSQVTLP